MLSKRYSLVLCCLVVCIFQTSLSIAQTPHPQVKNPGKLASKPPQSGPHTLLWEISGKGLRKPSYLFGTMHILCADDAKLSENLKAIIKKCEQIYFEIDMDNMQELMGAMKYIRMNDGIKISELLSKEEYDRVVKYFEKSKTPIPFSMMNRYKPLFVSSFISEQLMDCKAQNGMEMLVMQESKQYDKEILGLETVEFQAGLFDSIPYEKQAKDLVNYIDSLDNYKKTSLEMLEVYRKQDLNLLDSLVRKSDPGMDQYMDLLLYGRNRRWVSHMPFYMAGHSVLFAVGAGHLAGEQGLINLLRRKGYIVKPLKN